MAVEKFNGIRWLPGEPGPHKGTFGAAGAGGGVLSETADPAIRGR